MPLYTYLVTYKGEIYTVQKRRSNPKGFFPDWMEALPPSLRNLKTPSLSSFEAAPNRQNVWQILDGGDFRVVVVQTKE